MDVKELSALLGTLTSFPHEVEWVEFKGNNADPQEIGEYLSALANTAPLHGKQSGFLVWGVQDGTHALVGTRFHPRQTKVGNQELENWLTTQLSPAVNFKIHELDSADRHFVLFEVPAATHTPVRFRSEEYIRVGSYKKKLRDHPEKERELWALFSKTPFEKGIAKPAISSDQVLALIDYPAYFDLTKQPLPDNRSGIFDRLESESFIIREHGDKFSVTNLGAILFAKNLATFDRLSRKAVRVIIYKGRDELRPCGNKSAIRVMRQALRG